MANYRLFALTSSEAALLTRIVGDYVNSRNSHPSSPLTEQEMEILSNASRALSRGGFVAYTGSVTDQDGDSSWQLTSELKSIRRWADDMAVVSFDTPRTYRVRMTRTGFGTAVRLTTHPDSTRSTLMTGEMLDD